MTIPENTCSPNDTIYSILILNDQDEVLNFIVSTECNAQWLCEVFHEYGMYLEHEGIKWKRWEPEPDPPVDPDPEPPVQSEPPTNP